MEEDLRQLAFSEGFSATTKDELLQKIKDITVTVLHPSVHVVSLYYMTQLDGVTVEAFAARMKRTAGKPHEGVPQGGAQRMCLASGPKRDNTRHCVRLALPSQLRDCSSLIFLHLSIGQ